MGAKRKAVMLGCSDGRDRKGFTKELAVVLDLEGGVGSRGRRGRSHRQWGDSLCRDAVA